MSLKKSSAMKRVVHIARDHNEAKKWDIEQVISMTPEERQEAAKILKKRVFGEDVLDVRASATKEYKRVDKGTFNK